MLTIKTLSKRDIHIKIPFKNQFFPLKKFKILMKQVLEKVSEKPILKDKCIH